MAAEENLGTFFKMKTSFLRNCKPAIDTNKFMFGNYFLWSWLLLNIVLAAGIISQTYSILFMNHHSIIIHFRIWGTSNPSERTIPFFDTINGWNCWGWSLRLYLPLVWAPKFPVPASHRAQLQLTNIRCLILSFVLYLQIDDFPQPHATAIGRIKHQFHTCSAMMELLTVGRVGQL